MCKMPNIIQNTWTLKVSFLKIGGMKKYSTSSCTKFKHCLIRPKISEDETFRANPSNISTPSNVSDPKDAMPIHKPDGFISLAEFKARRYSVASRLLNFSKRLMNNSRTNLETIHHHLLIIPSSQRRYMVGKIPYLFRQATDFRYLTGHLVADAALILEIEHDGIKVKDVIGKINEMPYLVEISFIS